MSDQQTAESLDVRDRVDQYPGRSGLVPRGPAAEGSCHYIAVQAVHGSVFADLEPTVPVKSIGGVYDALIASTPGAVRGFRCDSEFWDVGTVLDYWRTSAAFMRKEGRPRTHLHIVHTIESSIRADGS